MGSDELIEGPILAHDDFLLVLCHRQIKIFFGLSMSWHFLALRLGYRCPGICELGNQRQCAEASYCPPHKAISMTFPVFSHTSGVIEAEIAEKGHLLTENK
jgi:hypothetical protein